MGNLNFCSRNCRYRVHCSFHYTFNLQNPSVFLFRKQHEDPGIILIPEILKQDLQLAVAGQSMLLSYYRLIHSLQALSSVTPPSLCFLLEDYNPTITRKHEVILLKNPQLPSSPLQNFLHIGCQTRIASFLKDNKGRRQSMYIESHNCIH